MRAQHCSRHLALDREDRALRILTTIGLGEELITVPWPDSDGRPALRTLTSTGVILCKNKDTKKVCTMFIANPSQVRRMYGQNHCPDYIYNIVKKNQVRFADIL